VTAEDIAERHGDKTEQYHDPRRPSIPQDAADDDERDGATIAAAYRVRINSSRKSVRPIQ